MRYLVTGGAGFIGSHLCELLLGQGHRVVVIDDESTGRVTNIQHLRPLPHFQFVRENINNAQVLDRLTSEADVVVHLAAAVGVELIVKDPVHTIRTNINGTEAVLAAAHRYSCKVIVASTSEVYGKGVRVPFREDDDRLMGPTVRSRWAYAESKAVDEFLSLAYHHQYGLPVIITRFFNTVGPRQTGRYGMVVPRFVRHALRGEPLQVYRRRDADPLLWRRFRRGAGSRHAGPASRRDRRGIQRRQHGGDHRPRARAARVGAHRLTL